MKETIFTCDFCGQKESDPRITATDWRHFEVYCGDDIPSYKLDACPRHFATPEAKVEIKETIKHKIRRKFCGAK